MKRAAFLLLFAAVATSCTHVVWYGRSDDRRHVASVLETLGRQHVRFDLRDQDEFRGVGVEGLQIAEGHVAYPAQLDEGGWTVVVDGLQGERFEGIGEVALSKQAVLFAAERAGHWLVVRRSLSGRAATCEVVGGCRDQEQLGPFESVLPHSLVERGDAWSFVARRDGKAWVVFNGRELGPFDAVGPRTFAGERVAFVARKDGAAFVVDSASDALPLGPFEDASQPVLEDGELLFARREAGAWRVGDGGRFERIAGLHPRLYAGRRDGHEWVVDGERERGPWLGLKKALARGKAGVVFAGRREAGWFVVRGDEELGPFEDVHDLQVVNGHDGFIGEREGRSVVVLDGRERSKWETAAGLTLSREGRALFVVRAGAQTLLEDSDDEAARPFDFVLADALVWSPDGAHFAAITGERRSKQLFVSFDDGARVPVDLEEFAAAVSRVPPQDLLLSPDQAWLRRCAEAELALHLSAGRARAR